MKHVIILRSSERQGSQENQIVEEAQYEMQILGCS